MKHGAVHLACVNSQPIIRGPLFYTNDSWGDSVNVESAGLITEFTLW